MTLDGHAATLARSLVHPSALPAAGSAAAAATPSMYRWSMTRGGHRRSCLPTRNQSKGIAIRPSRVCRSIRTYWLRHVSPPPLAPWFSGGSLAFQPVPGDPWGLEEPQRTFSSDLTRQRRRRRGAPTEARGRGRWAGRPAGSHCSAALSAAIAVLLLLCACPLYDLSTTCITTLSHAHIVILVDYIWEGRVVASLSLPN